MLYKIGIFLGMSAISALFVPNAQAQTPTQGMTRTLEERSVQSDYDVFFSEAETFHVQGAPVDGVAFPENYPALQVGERVRVAFGETLAPELTYSEFPYSDAVHELDKVQVQYELIPQEEQF